MKIASILENQNVEKRIAITPEIAKKYISLGFEVSLSENYASHLGINDEAYRELGVVTSNDQKEKAWVDHVKQSAEQTPSANKCLMEASIHVQ